MNNELATIMAQITSPHPVTSKKASRDNYGVPDLAGDLNSNPRAWLKNAEAALKSFLIPWPNWVPEAAKHLKEVAQAWYTNWIDANINFDDWDLFKEDFLSTFTTNETDQDLSLHLVDIRQTSTVNDLSERFEKLWARFQDQTQANNIHVRSMFIKALKGYIRQYMDTEKCTTLGRTYAEALAAKKKSNAAYKNNSAAWTYKKPREGCEGRKSRPDTRGKDRKTPRLNKPIKKRSTVLNNISFTSEEEEEEQGKERGSLY